jgi:hypothetical protein
LRDVLKLLVFCPLFFAAHAVALAPGPQIPKIWVGETMEPDQGGLTLSSVLYDLEGGHRDGSFSFILHGRKRGIPYIFQAETQDLKTGNATIWKIKDDIYDVQEVYSVDHKGRKFSWKGPYKQGLIVKAGNLSMFGAWYLVYGKAAKDLRLLIKPQPNIIPKRRLKAVFQNVIDGMTSRVLDSFGTQGDDNQGFRATIRATRSIQMTYKVDLFQDNRWGKDIVPILSANDAHLRSCYTDLLEAESLQSGILAYSFVYSGEAGSIKGLKIKGSGFKNPRFLECMYLKLLGLTFPVKKSMIGELTFQFQASE